MSGKHLGSSQLEPEGSAIAPGADSRIWDDFQHVVVLYIQQPHRTGTCHCNNKNNNNNNNIDNITAFGSTVKKTVIRRIYIQ